MIVAEKMQRQCDKHARMLKLKLKLKLNLKLRARLSARKKIEMKHFRAI